MSKYMKINIGLIDCPVCSGPCKKQASRSTSMQIIMLFDVCSICSYKNFVLLQSDQAEYKRINILMNALSSDEEATEKNDE